MREGTKIRDYIFEEKIGEGGMGEVWRARHAILDRQVAIKAMARHLEADPEFGRRFLQEAQSQARLSHPHIVGVSDFFTEDGQYFLVMPLMSGKNLADRLHELQGPLPLEEALAVARDVLDALDFAHQQGVIHRDVKPSNILLDEEGHAALTDFGIALSLGRTRVTQVTTSLGTPHYMSPEQIRSPRDVDHRTDVYSFGCVFYEMLTGRPPFAEASSAADDTDFALKEAHVYRAPESLRKWNPRIPDWLDAVVLRALAKNPDERFLGCGEFRRNLDAPAAPAPSAAPAPEPARAVRKPGPAPVRARRLPTALIALIGLAVAALAALVLFATRDRWQPAESAADGLTTDQGTTEPLGTDIEVIETGGAGAATEPGEQSAGEVPLVTDAAPIEPIEQETDEGEPKQLEPKKPEPEKPEPKKREPKEEADTDEPLDTDLEIRGGVVAPLDTDLGTVEPLGTELRPPGW
jgi:eukaryotic-like serine/threonine-protein kinase